VLLDEHADVIREAVKAVAAEMMELEVSELIGAEHGERRLTCTNPYELNRLRYGQVTAGLPSALAPRLAQPVTLEVGTRVRRPGLRGSECR
jgi:hypothetical protein